MSQFELKDPKILGEEHPQYGFTFWSITDSDFPVMFNSKNGNILPGTRIQAESSEEKISKNGKPYLRLKKVTFEDTHSKPSMPFTEKPEPTFHKANAEQTSKDTQITKNMVWKNLLSVYDVPSMKPDTAQWDEFWGNVELHTEMLTKGNYEALRSVQNGQQPSDKPSLKEQWDKTTGTKAVTEEYGDENQYEG